MNKIMQRKNLFKENSALLSPRQYNKINRDIQNIKRANKRADMYHNGRNISMSPEPILQELDVLPETIVTSTPAPSITKKLRQTAIDKENGNNIVSVFEHTMENLCLNKTTRIAKVACNNSENKKSRQDAYLQRFLDWKERQKREKELAQQKREKKPFISVIGNGSSHNAKINDIKYNLPQSQKFKPPANIIMHDNSKKNESVPVRRSVYEFKTSPSKKMNKDKSILQSNGFNINQNMTINSKMVSRSQASSRKKYNSKWITEQSDKIVDKSKMEIEHTDQVNPPASRHTQENGVKSKIVTQSTTPSVTRVTPVVLKTLVNSKVTTKTSKLAPTEVTAVSKTPAKVTTITSKTTPSKLTSANSKVTTTTTKPTPLKMTGAVSKTLVNSKVTTTQSSTLKAPPPLTNPSNNIIDNKHFKKPIIIGSAVSQAKLNNKKSAKLSVCLKAKKPTKIQLKKAALQNLKAINLTNKSKNMTPPMITPIIENANPDFLTSTQLKSSINSGQAKGFTNNEIQISAVKATDNKVNSKNERKMKFNFLRYSMTPSQTPRITNRPSSNKANVVKKLSMSNVNQTVVTNAIPEKPIEHSITEPLKEFVKTADTTDNYSTPPKVINTEQPTNYLSPFVTVSRGKVNAKTERVKRENIYLQNNLTPIKNDIKDELKPATPTTPVEIRRTLEAVRYFRKQLEDEIIRLHALCDQWELYKDENLEKLQESGGEDMINVTIGQTKLLTSKKFMQFNSLIDRCEAGANGNGVKDDGSEATKPISSIDLEGFWSMLGLQVDNLDKRFDNLIRWKNNDWIDPDEIQLKAKKNKVIKTKKSKVTTNARPNSNLQQMMRKMQAEIRKKREEELAMEATATATTTTDMIMASPKQKRRSLIQSPASRRTSIIIRDRKYHSQAATVISVPSPTGRNSISSDTPISVQQNKNLLKTAIVGADKVRRKSLRLQNTIESFAVNISPKKVKQSSTPTTPVNTLLLHMPKSILKTPGTSKGMAKNVIFSAKKRVKRFNFLMTDGGEENNESVNLNSRDNSLNVVNKSNTDDEDNKTTTTPDQRTYKLRNRKVYLRPSCEIIIPRET